MLKLFQLPRRLPEPVVHDWLDIYYVRNGERYFGHGMGDGLTPEGLEHATEAARFIRKHADGKSVVVFGDPDEIAYNETASTIAGALKTPLIDPLFRFEFNNADIPTVEGTHLQKGVNRFVVVEMGSMISVMLRTLPGPVANIGLTGPPYGSVHILRINLTIATGGRIAEKYFVGASSTFRLPR